MILIFVLTFVLFVNARAEYPGKSTLAYGTKLERSTPSSKNLSSICCLCNNTAKKYTVDSINITSPQEASLFRLPDAVWPILYRLSLKIDFNLFKTSTKGKVYGNLTISINVKNRTDVIYLHNWENLSFTNVSVRKIGGNNTKRNLIKNIKFDIYSVCQLNLISNLSVGEEYVIEINNFESNNLDNQDSGILIRKYQNSKGQFENMLVTQFQPESARTVFPCFDEPRFKSGFQLNMTTNFGYSILTNTPELACQKTRDFNGSAWITCAFEETPLMPVYNLAFAIVNFSHIEKTDGKGRKFRMWARHSEINKTQFALDATILAFELFEKNLKLDFPLKKVDSLAIPNLRGFLGMEHYGLITYEEPVISWSEKFPLSFSKYLCVSIICHEVAHQWFGNLVTMSWWKDLWLNEGFATFYSHKMATVILKDDWYYPLELISIFNYVRNFDDYFSLYKSSVSAPVSSYVEAKFDYLSYKKGFVIVNMFEKLLGTSAFDLSIVDYLNENKHNTTKPNDLWKSLSKLSNMPIPNIMDEWLNKVCYPIVEVQFNKNSSIKIKQNASIIFKVMKFRIKFKESTTDIWKIPLYIIFGNTTFQTKEIKSRLDKPSEILSLSNFNSTNHWLVLNVNYGSFFTTDYDEIMFTRLRNQLLINHLVIPPLNRAQIMQDYYDLSRKFNRSNLIGLLKLMVYIRNETDPIPLTTAINLLDKLNGLIEFRSFYPIWNKYVAKILQPTFDKFILDFQNDFRDPNSVYLILRRSIFNMACKLRSDHCTKIANKIVERWKNNKLFASDYDLLHVALCKYIEKDTNGERWQKVYSSNKFQSWDYINVKYYAMGCTRVSWAIEKNIDIAYNVLKTLNDRHDFPHVSQIVIDHVPPDYLHGITSLSNLLLLSSIYNTPNSMHFLNRFNKDGLNIIYGFLQYPLYFPLPNSIVEHAIPTWSHYNFIIYLSSPRDKSRNIILIEAKSNIKWILKNGHLGKQLQGLLV